MRSMQQMGKCLQLLAVAGLAAFGHTALAQNSSVAKTVRDYADSHRHEIADEYLQLLAVNNLHGNVEGLQKNADLLLQMMKKRGLDAEQWPTSTGVPVVFGQKIVPGAKRTILFY